MSELPNTSAAADDRRRTWEDRLAGPMFFLALAFLVVLAGVIHRFPRLDWGDPEGYLILGGLAGLWLVLLVEAVGRFRLHDRSRPAWLGLGRATVCGLLPPLRLGCRSQVRPTTSGCPDLAGGRSTLICTAHSSVLGPVHHDCVRAAGPAALRRRILLDRRGPRRADPRAVGWISGPASSGWRSRSS